MRIYLSKDLYLTINSIKGNSSVKTSHFLATLVKNNQGVRTYTPVEISSYNPDEWDTNYFSDFPHQDPENWALCSPVRLDLGLKKQFGSILYKYNINDSTAPGIVKADQYNTEALLPDIKLNIPSLSQTTILENPALEAISHLKLMALHTCEKEMEGFTEASEALTQNKHLNLSQIQELKHEISRNLDVSKNDLYSEVQAFFSS